MTVFVLTSAFDYEGESPIGVCASLELAKAWAEKKAKELGYESAEWVTVREQLELQCGSTQWVIREEEVQGGEELAPMCGSLAKYGRCDA